MRRKDTIRRRPLHGFTLVELLVVITILTLLFSIGIPAIQAARESSRNNQCKANLHEFGVGMLTYASTHNRYCSGAFDWKEDGSVIDTSWIADQVAMGGSPGKMLCPSNPNTVTETFVDLLDAVAADLHNLKPEAYKGSADRVLPDDTVVANPCRHILTDSLAPGTTERLGLVQELLDRGYNTNYVATWYLVRSGLRLDPSGNLFDPQCLTTSRSIKQGTVVCTQGPLGQHQLDSSGFPGNTVPLMACGAASDKKLSGQLRTPNGLMGLAVGKTPGPRTMTFGIPSFPPGTPMAGASGWYAGWNATRQDYRGIGTWHAQMGNVLFADGSVRGFFDASGDGLLNNGFSSSGTTGFNDAPGAKEELPRDEVVSSWVLRNPR